MTHTITLLCDADHCNSEHVQRLTVNEARYLNREVGSYERPLEEARAVRDTLPECS